MPALDNPRHERLARYFVKLGVKSRAYVQAGYTENTTRASLDAAASRAFRSVKMKRRIYELRKQMAQRTRITLETLLHDLAEDRALARETKQVSAAIAATQLSAKLVGLLVDRKETGQPGDFAGLTSADEVLDLVRKELGDDTADALAAALSKQDAAETAGEPAAAPMIDAERGVEDTLN